MAERGITVVHTTIMRWVIHYVPLFEKRWEKYARPVGSSWRVDETYIKVKGKWTYLYRAVDKEGMTVDFLLSEKRDMAAAKRFFIKAIRNNEAPAKITLGRALTRISNTLPSWSTASPEIMILAIDFDEHLIHVPFAL